MQMPSNISSRGALLALAFAPALACGLLVPYPGGGDPLQAFTKAGSGIPGAEDPLIDPPTDDSVAVVSALVASVAVPGAGFPIELEFVAQNSNVVGGGIRLPGSDEVQWTLINGVLGQNAGTLSFSYVLPDDACEGLTNLCHPIQTEQFAVVQDSVTNELRVSEPVEVKVVLQCATCDSDSCIEELTDIGEMQQQAVCRTCAWPEACQTLNEQCYAEGAPFAGTDEAEVYEVFMGPYGILWTSIDGCVSGEQLCEEMLLEDTCEI